MWSLHKRALKATEANNKGIPCKEGHVGCWRETKYTGDGFVHKRCSECTKIYNNKWQKSNPEYAKQWASEHIEGRRLSSRKFRTSSPERHLYAILRCKKWQREHPERNRFHGRTASLKRRAIKRKTKLGRIDFKKILIGANGLCGICKKELGCGPIEFDHIIPLARGGTHTQDNLQVSHGICNHKKGTKLVSELRLVCPEN